MDINTKANMVEQTGKILAYALRAVVLKPKKPVKAQEIAATPSLPVAETPLLPSPVAPQLEWEERAERVPLLESEEGPGEKPTTKPTTEEVVSTACLSCSRSHLSTVSGALGESLRFARGDPGGIKHPEVQRRIMLAEDEILMLERIDMAPDALSKASPEERLVADEYLPRIRVLRQNMGNISSVDNLQDVAAEASILGQEFRLRLLQLKGFDLNPIVELARKVETGEISMDQAKERVKELLPEEIA